MYVTTDIWLSPETAIEPNGTHTGLSIRAADDVSHRVTLFFGHTEAEIENTRMRINLAIDQVLDARERTRERQDLKP